MSRAIEEYGLIGDGHTAALVSRDGAVDWLCWPRFDSDACFAALLGTEANGSWVIRPTDPGCRVERRYEPDTLVLETTFRTGNGVAVLRDFMPLRGDDTSSLVRIVEGVEGSVSFETTLRLRFDYGTLPPWSEPLGDGFVARLGPDTVVLYPPVRVSTDEHVAGARFTVRAGESLPFVLRYGSSDRPPPDPIDPVAALDGARRRTRDWIGGFDDARTAWPEVVRRSLLTLRAMIHQPSGGIVAAPTTSLPEAPGGTMNWDYRYSWLRDATFTLRALLGAGFHHEARRWRDWLLRAVAGSPESMRIMYRVDGARHLSEWEVDALPGYDHARPVRIGNAASTQKQVDVYGEVLTCLLMAADAGIPVSDAERGAVRAICRHLEQVWDTPGSGIWESRDRPRQYTYSKIMAWAAIKGLAERGRREGEDQARMDALERLRDRIHADVCAQGWNAGLNRFTQYYGGHELDASLLLMVPLGFLPPDDPRLVATVEAIARELGEGGLIRRNRPTPGQPAEGTFLACSCWMADSLAIMGRHAEARAQFERVLSVANDLGLFAEEYDVPAKRQAGNFPQALTHLAVINTALLLSGRAGKPDPAGPGTTAA